MGSRGWHVQRHPGDSGPQLSQPHCFSWFPIDSYWVSVTVSEIKAYHSKYSPERINDKQEAEKTKLLVAQLCPTLSDPRDGSLLGSSVHGASPGDLPDQGTKPRSPALPADSSWSEPPGKTKKTKNWSLSGLESSAYFHHIGALQHSSWQSTLCPGGLHLSL